MKAEAQRLGWAKAYKLANRNTVQGVIALGIDNKNELATMVEVNCETDFVARNKIFHSVVEVVTSSCLNFANTQDILKNSFSKVFIIILNCRNYYYCLFYFRLIWRVLKFWH